MNINLVTEEDATRPDKEQAERIDEALLLQQSSGLDVATCYMTHHGVATDTLLRILLSSRSRRLVRDQGRANATELQQVHAELALDEALAEGFPASDPVAISIA